MAVSEQMMQHLHRAEGGGTRRQATFLPEPEPRTRHYTIISVDDHLIEPADLFEGRVPKQYADRAPRVVTMDDGRETWVYEDSFYPQVGLNAVAGRPKDEWSMEPARFDEMRRGCWDVEARVHDMDLDGIYASLCFPSLIAGFAGTIFATSKDEDLGLACLRAWNDWHIEEWAGPHPDRIIPLQLAWLRDPEVAAADVYANAERGFKAVSFPENPVDLRLPSMHDPHWDPFLRACEETETVVCLHNGSSSWTAARSPGAPLELYTSLFPVNALVTAADWLWARIPTRFPRIKVAFSEGGISWVPMLIDRIEYVLEHSAVGSHGWDDPDLSPTDAMRRNFWFCTIDLGSTFALRDHIGLDHICLESDYPHADSTWPETQALAERGLAPLSDDEVRKVTWQNASTLFRHPVPPDLQLP
ncbi:MAG TPA: amidohydrolase family protein [Acidimicrobiia bacterium]|nr:amidohydrolase family protein [Acidimicrobiia bacterium]